MLDSISKDISLNDYNGTTNTPIFNNQINIAQNLTSRDFKNSILLSKVVKKATGEYLNLNTKKEIQLPKTKLTKHGQILLYTSQENKIDLKCWQTADSNSLVYKNHDPLLSPVSNNSSTLSAQNLFAKKLIQKSYSKKWTNQINDDFYFDISDIIINEKLKGTNLNPILKDKNILSQKAGRNTEFYINELRTKSGKDRYLKKATYSDYLPIDFDTRFSVADSIKSLNSRKNSNDSFKTQSRNKSSHTSTSVYSQDNGISSEDEDLTIIEESLKTQSRLSSQPVLSAQNLINRLNFKSTADQLVNKDPFDNRSNNPNDSPVTIKYKDTFRIDDLEKKSLNGSLNGDENFNENVNLNHLDTININKKILTKRIDQNKTVQSDLETSKIVKISSAPTYFTGTTSYVPSNSTANSKSNQLARRSSLKSPKLVRKFLSSPLKVKHDDVKQIPDGFFIKDKDQPSLNLISTTPFKGSDESKKPCFNFKINNNNNNIKPPSSAPINSSRQAPVSGNSRQTTSAHHVNKLQKKFSNPETSENLEPFTISITQIDNQDTGHIIKLRKYYDRQALRIKKLNTNNETTKMAENKKALEYCLNLKTAIERGISTKHRASSFALIKSDNLEKEQNESNEKTPLLKAQNSLDEDYLKRPNDEIPIKIMSNTKATISQEILFNNDRIDQLSKKINDQIDDMNQSVKKLPTSPHSSFDLSAMAVEYDEPGDYNEEEKIFISKSIDLINDDNDQNDNQQKPSSEIKATTSFSDFIQTTLQDFKNEIEIAQQQNVQTMEEENLVAQQSLASIKEDYYDLNENVKFCDDSELSMKNDKKHYTSYADVEVNVNEINKNGQNEDNETAKLVSENSNYDSPDIKNQMHDVNSITNNPNHSELNLMKETNQDIEIVNHQISDINDKNGTGKLEVNIVFELDQDESVKDETNENEIELEENDLNCDYETIENEINQNNEIESNPNLAFDKTFESEIVETVNMEKKESTEQQINNVEEETLNQSHEPILNVKHKKIFIILNEKTTQTSFESDDDHNNETRSSETNMKQKNELLDSGIEKIASLNNKEFDQSQNENIISVIQPELISKRNSLGNIKTMAAADGSHKKVHFSNKVNVSHDAAEMVKQKSIEVNQEDKNLVEKINESKIAKEFLNALTVQTNDRLIDSNSPLPIATNKSAKMGSSSASASEIEPNNKIMKKAVKLAKGKKKASKDAQKLQQFSPEYLKELEEREQKVLIAKKNNKGAKYPHFQLPYNSENAIADPVLFEEKFKIPDCLCPDLYEIDPQNVSIEELILERRILEEKIIELREKKLSNLENINQPIGESSNLKKGEKKKLKSSNKVKSVETSNKDKEMKDKIFKEERMRLQNEHLKRQIEREKIFNLIIENRQQKDVEVENLNKDLQINTEEFNTNLAQIELQIKYLEKSEDEIREAIATSKAEMRKQIIENNNQNRKSKKAYFDEIREEKMFQFDVKRKELEWVLSLYKDQEEIEKINAQITSLDIEIQDWLNKHENEISDQEKYFDDFEEEQENKLAVLEQQEEENSLKSLKQEQYNLMQEKMNLIDNYESMKMKILDRIKNIEIEKTAIENEKNLFEQDNKNTIEQQKAKLIEILKDEYEAKEKIKNELEAYRNDLMAKREKNLQMKCDVSFMKHCHFITKAFVFSYGIHWPIELFSKSVSSDKKSAKAKAVAK